MREGQARWRELGWTHTRGQVRRPPRTQRQVSNEQTDANMVSGMHRHMAWHQIEKMCDPITARNALFEGGGAACSPRSAGNRASTGATTPRPPADILKPRSQVANMPHARAQLIACAAPACLRAASDTLLWTRWSESPPSATLSAASCGCQRRRSNAKHWRPMM